MSDTEPEDDSDNDDKGILNAFTATVNPIDGIVEKVDEEEDLVESKFEKIDEQNDIHTTYAKLYKVSKKHELSIKVDEANQTIRALWFEKNFLAEKTKKFEAELFQVRPQLERTFSAKLGEMSRLCLVTVFVFYF